MCESEIEEFAIHLCEDLSNKEDWPFIVNDFMKQFK